MTHSRLFGGLVLGTALLVGGRSAHPAPTVTVNNTVANPVPVTGEVAIGGTPTVRLEDGTVQVGNDDANPIPVRSVDDSRRELVQGAVLVQIEGAQTRAAASLYEVPHGKRVVIEHLSVAKYEGPDGLFQVITFTDDAFAVTHYIAALAPGRTGDGEVVLLRSAHGLQAEVDFFVPHGGAVLRFSFSGYLEDLP